MLDFLRDLLAPNRPRLMIKADNAFSIKTPLVPANSVAGRSLVMVIAIMTFLAALTAGAATLIAEASSDWRGEAASEASIQLRPTKRNLKDCSPRGLVKDWIFKNCQFPG